MNNITPVTTAKTGMVTIKSAGGRRIYLRLGTRIVCETWRNGSVVRTQILTPRAGLSVDQAMTRLSRRTI